LLRTNPGYVPAYVGLGEAELAQGDFHRAQANFVEALRHNPGDANTISRLQFASSLSQLDPTPRRLSSRAKFERSSRLLELAESELSRCGPSNPEKAQPLIDAAHQLQAENPKGPVTNEMAEARLALTEDLWRLRNESCQQTPAANDPLPVIMHKLTQ